MNVVKCVSKRVAVRACQTSLETQDGFVVPALDVSNARFHLFQFLSIGGQEVNHGVVRETKGRAWNRVVCLSVGAITEVQCFPLSRATRYLLFVLRKFFR